MIFRYATDWPYRRMAWLHKASDIDYAFELMGVGKFQFSLPINDVGVSEGDLIGIVSGKGLPDFAGSVDTLEESLTDGTVRVSGVEWSGVLRERLIAQERTYYSGASGDIARDILRRTAARSATGIVAYSTGSSEPLLSPLALRARDAMAGIDQLATVTGWEWEIRYRLDATATAEFMWKAQAGQDLRNSVHLAGAQIADANYQRDAIKDSAVVQVIGSLGEFAGRPSAVVTDAPVALQDIATVRLSATARRRSIFEARETAILEPSLPDGMAVQRRARESLSAILAGPVTLDLTLSPSAPWDRMRAGNIVTVHLPRVRFGEGASLVFRIYAMQPDEINGRCYLTGKVL